MSSDPAIPPPQKKKIWNVLLVECDDDEANDGAALFKTMEAFRGTFFFSTSVELKRKGAVGGGAGREMIDSNTFLLSMFTPKHFFGCFCDLF